MNLTMEFDHHITAHEVADLMIDVGDRLVDQAKNATTNKVLQQARTAIRKHVSGETGIPSRMLSKRMKLHNANRQRPTGRLFIGTMPVKAIDLSAKGIRAGGIAYGGKGHRVQNDRAFKAQMHTGHIGIFQRRGKSRLPIDEVKVPFHSAARSKAQSWMRNEAKGVYARVYPDQLKQRIQREVARRFL